MTLPAILPPPTLPLFLAAGQSIDEGDVYADVQPAAGASRKRRVRTLAERTVSVQWLLSQAQMTALDDWFEDTLLVGQRHFTAEVSNEGVGQAYWDAMWKAPYEANPIPTAQGVMWQVSGSLTLFGAPASIPPSTGALTAAYILALDGLATVLGETALTASYGLGLGVVQRLAAAYVLALDNVITDTSRTISVGAGSLRAIGRAPAPTVAASVVIVMQFAASDETTGLAVGQLISVPILQAMLLSRVVATLVTAQASGSILTLDIKKNGTTILSTLLTIDNTELTSATAATPYVLSTSSLAVDDIITVHCTQVGSGSAAGLKIGLVGAPP